MNRHYTPPFNVALAATHPATEKRELGRLVDIQAPHRPSSLDSRPLPDTRPPGGKKREHSTEFEGSTEQI